MAFWTKKDFEKVLAQICIDDVYEHLNYTMLVLYFMTGMQVNEATALYWEDIDFKRKQIHVCHNLMAIKLLKSSLSPRCPLKEQR